MAHPDFPREERRSTIVHQDYSSSFGGPPAENYHRFFVPAIGLPVAKDLVAKAELQPGQRVLDVACGTGVVTRLAAERVGFAGSVAGLDLNPAMLAVARSQTSPDAPIEWYEASAESMPLGDRSFDLVLCQMGLQFVPDKLAALREMCRVLDIGGRAVITLPGPKPRLFAIMSNALSRHLNPQAASFVDIVFSLHDADEVEALLRAAGFSEIKVDRRKKILHLPLPSEFLWQYILSTPMAEAARRISEEKRDALERDVSREWQEFVVDGSMVVQVSMTTATAK